MKQIDTDPWESSIHQRDPREVYAFTSWKSDTGKSIFNVYGGFDVRDVSLEEGTADDQGRASEPNDRLRHSQASGKDMAHEVSKQGRGMLPGTARQASYLLEHQRRNKGPVSVAFHGQPYKGRDDHAVHENIKYIVDRYRSHPAFYKYKTSTGKSLPLFYIYDSYLTRAESWASLLTPSGSHSLRNTAYNAVFVALLVEEEGHKHDILSTGYDGTYTYFASNGFSFGSSHQNWKAIKTFWDSNNLIFIPSVGPGYIDTSIRPWNNHNTRNRVSGKYYETALQAALMVRPEIVSITSFSEWHRGTQTEKAVPKTTLTHLYLGYLPHQPSMYLELTHRWAEHFSKEKEQCLM
ncbi:LOW QUALITY PROTEIN: glycoprotein endo-alpha-1,2-mannosidase-like protein [Ciconia maguari]